MNIEYTKQGDYLIPNLIIPKGKKVNYGKYARLRLEYIKNHKKGFYTMLKMENKLDEHLADVDFVANWHINAITDYIAEQEGITEELKATKY